MPVSKHRARSSRWDLEEAKDVGKVPNLFLRGMSQTPLLYFHASAVVMWIIEVPLLILRKFPPEVAPSVLSRLRTNGHIMILLEPTIPCHLSLETGFDGCDVVQIKAVAYSIFGCAPRILWPVQLELQGLSLD